jgi:predicted GTPase
MKKKRVIIMGAAGRDFHNFNVFFRDNEDYDVVAFTATQIPDIEGRIYPKELAGSLYPDGVPIHAEEELPDLIEKLNVDLVVFAYSDTSHEYVMHKASMIMAAGADFMLMGTRSTQVESKKPVISVCAVRTGCGKSQTVRRITEVLKDQGKRIVVIRHPMPYGNLVEQAVQRFATYEDMDKHGCTIEEREEYEPHISMGNVVYAGVDYERILRQAEEEADVVLWDGGNNDFSFYKADLDIAVADPHRAGHGLTYHPGETVLRMADVVVINKIDTATQDFVELVQKNVRIANPTATVIMAKSPVTLLGENVLEGREVLVIEDGPTLTHGGMAYGAGVVAANKYGAKSQIDPRPYAVRSIGKVYEKYPHLGNVLPAMGYSKDQLAALEETINRTPAEVVLVATPIDLGKVIQMNKRSVRVKYDLEEVGSPDLKDVLGEFFASHGGA